LLDTNRNELRLICKQASWIDPEQMSAMKPISYKARDDLTIHGYLTLPVGSDGKNLPLIVMPHGGPWARDIWGFDPEVQFLANRGFAVLQMNFRGSTGYGREFEKAGYREWGRKMQDDITDGVEWAIREGIADRNHIGIFGASYGGYAALMGLIRTPELFKCGICYVGVTDIITHLKNKTIPMPKVFDSMKQELIGYYDIEKEDLDAVSPLQHVDKIRAPLFLAYGGRDPVVNVEQGRSLAKALDKAKKKYEMVIEENEGHGFSNETNRIKLFKKIDKFLKANL
jgi:dipeptidyl aminopeptidase/acylaminoacyl peptidase